MAIYTFVKNVAQSILREQLFATPIGSMIVSVSSQGTVVTIITSQPLNENQTAILYNTVNSHTPPPQNFAAVQTRVQQAIQFGQSLMLNYATQNIMRGITVEQVDAVADKLSSVQMLLNTGSLYAALNQIENLQPDEWIRQQDIDYFTQQIRNFLGIMS